MTSDQRIRNAFHELATALLSLFEIYKAPPGLIDETAEEVSLIFRRYIPAPVKKSDGTKGKLILERLLDELEIDNPDINKPA